MNEVADSGYKLNKKVKLAVGKAKASKNGFKSEGDRRKKKPSESEIEGPSMNYKINGSALQEEKENGGKRSSGSGVKERRRHLGQEGYKVEIDETLQLGQASLDWKRKRIYVDQEKRNTRGGKSREIEISNGGFSSTTRRKSYKDKVIDVKDSYGSHENRKRSYGVSDGKFKTKGKAEDRWVSNNLDEGSNENRKRSYGVSDGKFKTKGKAEDRWVSTNLDEGESGLQKKHAKSKFDSTKHVNQRQNRSQSLDKTTKKIMHYKKDLDDQSVETDMPPKKRKLVMRIDPHDISNKRLDDGIFVNEKVVEKKADPEEKTELSKNAQFRAIQPSPSILSFVEDNLLGRRRLIELRRSGYNIELSAPLDNIPFSTSSERERIEESVFRNKLTYFAAAKVSSSFPPAELPEIAFAGRSNVGKSSLLNALTRQWGVVRTSDKPGHTQTINFFKLGTKLCMVDLPGYGFAYAKEEVKDAWEELVKEYVSTRVGLKRVCLLIDTKWGMKPRDHELINLMERSQTKYQIILTKTDVVFPLDVARQAMQIEENLKANKSIIRPLMMVSSQTGAGIRSLRTVLAKVARFVKV